MTTMEAFHHMGISLTKDVSKIKQAYHGLLSHHHPEEDPEGFMRLHHAYKTALAYAQGTGGKPLAEFSWSPSESRPSREKTAYDSLFSNLEENPPVDISLLKNTFSRKLLHLKLHWLPISLRSWKKFFGSEVFRLCRGVPDCMESLFDLLTRKVHSYGVFCFILSQLWELDAWQHSEDMYEPAKKTQACIKELKTQYSHYLKLNPAARTKRLCAPVLWYYQALPFYFKLIVSTFVLPLLSCGSPAFLILLVFVFYFLELCTWIRKYNRGLGFFHITVRMKNGSERVIKKYDNGLVIVGTVYAILLHFAACVSLAEAFVD